MIVNETHQLHQVLCTQTVTWIVIKCKELMVLSLIGVIQVHNAAQMLITDHLDSISLHSLSKELDHLILDRST